MITGQGIMEMKRVTNLSIDELQDEITKHKQIVERCKAKDAENESWFGGRDNLGALNRSVNKVITLTWELNSRIKNHP